MSTDGDDLSRYRLSEPDNERIFRDRIVPTRLSGYLSHDHPVVVVLMAQPGAGKSKFAAEIREVLRGDGGAVEIDSDLYKPFHPQYARLMRTDDQKMAAATRTDGRAWMGKAQAYVRENRLHAIFHETAQDPTESMQTLDDYRTAGYQVAVLALGVHESQSQQGVLHRYQEQVNDRGSGRLTVPANAHRSYRGIAEVAALIDDTAAADLVAVYRRTIDTTGPAHLNRLTPTGDWAEPPRFARALTAERNRPLSADEVVNFQAVQQRLRSSLPDELQPWLSEVDGLAQSVIAPDDDTLADYRTSDAGARHGHHAPHDLASSGSGLRVAMDNLRAEITLLHTNRTPQAEQSDPRRAGRDSRRQQDVGTDPRHHQHDRRPPEHNLGSSY
ncbi:MULTISPECIES: zeta toxin family protein [unclassified Pseudonocardia]|uniref:zeta toxin family protein n=1 Tax=unclassified Pseudonocardia TaxID=2619320 RepID=UPI0001FFDDB5|nr:zeta toxin family protein [Pseudonocardia sp. Ae707_Ps1]OLM09131.1 putative ATP/GTP-binding protein [Pseudonocardia sp. Ae707_Ps1]